MIVSEPCAQSISVPSDMIFHHAMQPTFLREWQKVSGTFAGGTGFVLKLKYEKSCQPA